MKTIVSVLTAGAILTGGFVTTIRAQKSAHVLQMEKEAQWGPAPPMLPPGAQIAVLTGDPSKPAPSGRPIVEATRTRRRALRPDPPAAGTAAPRTRAGRVEGEITEGRGRCRSTGFATAA